MTTWSTEDLVDAAVDTLSTSLPAALAAQYAARAAADAAAGRTILYEAPRPGLAEAGGDYHAGGAQEILRYPTIEVALPDFKLSGFDIALIEGDSDENLIVCAWEQSPNMVFLYRKLTRLIAAIEDVLITPNVLGGAQVIGARGAFRWNPENSEADQIESGALLILSLRSLRTRP